MNYTVSVNNTQKSMELPCIQLISHSHGGNIGLNLPAIGKQYEKRLMIDKLIMMGCPVQAKTNGND